MQGKFFKITWMKIYHWCKSNFQDNLNDYYYPTIASISTIIPLAHLIFWKSLYKSKIFEILDCACLLQWGSENCTCPVFEWSTMSGYWMVVGFLMVGHYHSKTRLNVRFLSCFDKMAAILSITIWKPDLQNVRYSNVSGVWMFGIRIPTVC